MSTQKIVFAIGAFILCALVVGLACHGAGLNARGFMVLPIGAGVAAAWFVLKKSGVQ